MAIVVGNNAVVVTHDQGDLSNLNVRSAPVVADNNVIGQFTRSTVVHIDDGPFGTTPGGAQWWKISANALQGYGAGEYLDDAGAPPANASAPAAAATTPAAPDAPAATTGSMTLVAAGIGVLAAAVGAYYAFA